METKVTCSCQSCNGPIEFDPGQFHAGEAVVCPHCSAETALLLPETTEKSSQTEDDFEQAFSAACICKNCFGRLEFAPAEAGSSIQCPHCGQETMLFIPKTSGTPQASLAQNVTSRPDALPNSAGLIVTTGNEISGRVIERYLGLATGTVVRSPDFAEEVLGGLKQLVGGNIGSFARVCEAARKEAFNRMISQATVMEADAVIGLRYDATEYAPGITEVFAYGTAVKLATT